MLGPVGADPKGDDAEIIGEVNAVDHECDEPELPEIGTEHVGECRLSKGHQRREIADFDNARHLTDGRSRAWDRKAPG